MLSKRVVRYVSQFVPKEGKRYQEKVDAIYFPWLKWAHTAVESATGYQWRPTSHWRQSPSHSQGIALDIAPEITPSDRKFYAVYRRSDPVLYKRAKLLRQLQSLCRKYNRAIQDGTFVMPYSIGLFIEPDHIHIHIAAPDPETGPQLEVVKWGIAKPVYPDTYQRMKLPLITRC